MKTISLGLLLPTSSILPVSKDFERGVKEGFRSQDTDITLELVKEFIGQGSLKQTEEACSRFFNYHEVDAVTGVVSHKVADDIADQFNKNKIPFIINELGSHIPNVGKLSTYTHVNSMHLWQHAWAIGNWGVQNFGKKGMYVSSVYDSGYAFSQMFHTGMMHADANAQWSFSVTPMPPSGSLADVSVIFPYLESYQPDFVFATFCGTETTLFLNECIARGWHKKTQFIGLPYLTSALETLHDDFTIHTTASHYNNTAIEANRAFYHLGYETGVLLAKAAAAGGNLNEQLQQFHAGLKLANEQQTTMAGNYDMVITRNDIKAGQATHNVQEIASLPGFEMEYHSMKSLVHEVNFGWMNPYLCV
ncbi:ABC-type branched-chain amino acid transport system, substrate-binding protein [Filimonas lacunae]|uniref:ABC-type branched-chain amino acid transport system, substrate-binding protein n=1 Tax=Filimonas lacunae TaxID=477680 RepID=A0A173M9Y1_9BACT|nr:ABC transporter substrate-binding protein [Filimonas lacunae]BAV04321.1 hypothetical protein FLA_0308 [Filimonas lacunae]SIT31017.1 ABC-type branched-chain amino acid transport system, substrate-binding protein [Filimonas lacunae]